MNRRGNLRCEPSQPSQLQTESSLRPSLSTIGTGPCQLTGGSPGSRWMCRKMRPWFRAMSSNSIRMTWAWTLNSTMQFSACALSIPKSPRWFSVRPSPRSFVPGQTFACWPSLHTRIRSTFANSRTRPATVLKTPAHTPGRHIYAPLMELPQVVAMNWPWLVSILFSLTMAQARWPCPSCRC